MYKVLKNTIAHTFVLLWYVFFVFVAFFFYLVFNMGPIHHIGISDINTVFQINGSLTGPAADIATRLSP